MKNIKKEEAEQLKAKLESGKLFALLKVFELFPFVGRSPSHSFPIIFINLQREQLCHWSSCFFNRG